MRFVRWSAPPVLPPHYSDLAAFFKSALEADRKVWVTCSHCDKRTEAEIPDWTARAKTLEMMLNQGFGRPPSGDPDGGGGFILKRVIVAPDGTEMPADGGALDVVSNMTNKDLRRLEIDELLAHADIGESERVGAALDSSADGKQSSCEGSQSCVRGRA